MEVQDQSPDQEDHAGEVMESMGVQDGSENASMEAEPQEERQEQEGRSKESLAVQKRLKAQKRAHEREVRDLHARIGELENRMSQPMHSSQNQAMDHYSAPEGGNIDEHIHKAVSYALQHKENEERKAREAQSMAHVHRKYQEFEKHLDNMGDVYDDFHDVVMAPDAKFTHTMRDYAARTMAKHGPGSAGEVLYKLGKNPQELERIANLHPDDQAEELHKLSLALMKGGENKSSQSSRPLGQIKSNPVTNSANVTDKTPIGSIRQRMKSGSWK